MSADGVKHRVFLFQDHNCVKELRYTVQKQKQKINELQNQVSEHTFIINELRRETNILKVSKGRCQFPAF